MHYVLFRLVRMCVNKHVLAYTPNIVLCTLGTAAWNWTLVIGVGLVLTMDTMTTDTPAAGEF